MKEDNKYKKLATLFGHIKNAILVEQARNEIHFYRFIFRVA